MPLNDNDRDLMIRTIIGEAGGEGPTGQAAVANVIMNRVLSGEWGDTPSQVVLSRGQFEPWATRSRELMGISRNSPQYQDVGQIVDGVANGTIADPTNGATYFLNPSIVEARTGTLPQWAQGQPVAQIGHHNFYNPDQQQQAASPLSAIYKALGEYQNEDAQ